MWLNRESAWRIKRMLKITSVSQRNAACASLSLSSLSTMSKSVGRSRVENFAPSEKLLFQSPRLGGRVLRVHRTPVKELFQSFFPRRFLEPDQRVNPKLGPSHRVVLNSRRRYDAVCLGRPEKCCFSDGCSRPEGVERGGV